MKFRTILFAAALGAASAAVAAAPQNLVKNPGFDAGLEDWTSRGFQLFNTGNPQQNRMLTLCVGVHCLDTPGSGAFIGQQLSTTPGQLYDLSFLAGAGTGPGEFSIYWNGLLLDDQAIVTSTFAQHSYTSLLATADTTMLEIHGRDDPAHMWVDDVSVTEHVVSAVPEPQTYAMLLSGLLFAGMLLRRGP